MRIALSFIIGLVLMSAAYSQAPPAPANPALYASAGPELMHYELDPAAAALTKRLSVTLPQDVQYAWPHPTRRILYVAWSNGVDGREHGVTALTNDAAGA